MATVPTFAPGVATTTTDLLFAEHGRPVGFAVAASQSVASGGWAALTFGTPALDRGSGFATPTYQAGNTLGLYRVTGQVQFAASTSGSVRGVRVVLNGGAVPGGCAEVPVSAASTPQAVPLPVTYLACTASTDVLTLQVLQDTGGSINVTGALSVEWQGEMGVISAPVGLITDTASIPTGPVPTPNTPTFGTFTAAATLAADGTSSSSITVTWIPTTTNTDSSTDTDGDHYEIQYRQTGTTAWTSVQADWSATSYAVLGLPLATSFDFQIRAVNGQGENAVPSAWSSTSTQTSATSTTPPGQPDAATVAASLIAVQVSHDLGLASGGSFNLPANLDHIEVHFGASSGFTPSGLTLVGKLQATYGMMQAGISAVGSFLTSSTATVWVKVVAVDSNGNRSTASPAASTTATLIDDSHISSLTASKITAGTITAAVIIGGSATFSGTLSGATGTFSGTLSASTISGSTITGTTISGGTVTGATVQTASSGQRVVLNTAGQIDIIGSLGNTGHILVNALGEMLIQAPGTTINLDGAGSTINSSWSVTGYISASSGWSGAFSASSISTSGTLSSTGNFTTYGTTTTINPSGNINATASGIYVTASSGPYNVSGSTQFNAACGSSSVNVTSTTISLNCTALKSTGIVTGSGAQTLLLSGTQIFHLTSSRKTKSEISYDVPELTWENLMALRPATFYDKRTYEEAGRDGSKCQRILGVIAEDVDQIPGLRDLLVEHDDDGDPAAFFYQHLAVGFLPLLADLQRRLTALENA